MVANKHIRRSNGQWTRSRAVKRAILERVFVITEELQQHFEIIKEIIRTEKHTVLLRDMLMDHECMV